VYSRVRLAGLALAIRTVALGGPKAAPVVKQVLLTHKANWDLRACEPPHKERRLKPAALRKKRASPDGLANGFYPTLSCRSLSHLYGRRAPGASLKQAAYA
jgi:hypothetical protein